MSWREKVLEKIVPDKSLRLKVLSTGKEIVEKIKALGYDAEFLGSCARGTFLKDDIDLDIFVPFSEDVSDREMEKVIIEIAKSILESWELHKASHPYVRGEYKGFTVEIVPYYKVKGKIISAVDRTPHHHAFLKDRIKGKEEDVILLKKLLKTQHLYGAENGGFSGYLCELLVWYFDGFEELLKKAKDWRRGERIEIINSRKIFEEPLIVIDPVDPNRNAAACVSLESFAKFVVLARAFLKNPSEKWFFEPMGSKGGETWILELELKGPEEIAKAQLRKLEKRVKAWLEENGFYVLRVEGKYEKKCLCIEIGGYLGWEKRKGPRFYDGEHVERFLEKYEEVWIEGERLYAILKGKYKSVEECMNAFTHYPSHIKPIKIKRSPCIFERTVVRKL